MAKRYFHVVNKQPIGPFSGTEIKQRAKAGIIRPEHHIQEDGSPLLYEAGTVSGLFDTPSSTSAGSYTQPSASGRTREVAATGNEQGSPIHPSPTQSDPKFQNPVSTLLNSITSIALDTLHSRNKKGELPQGEFERIGGKLLLELQSAIMYTEAMPVASSTQGAVSEISHSPAAGFGASSNSPNNSTRGKSNVRTHEPESVGRSAQIQPAVNRQDAAANQNLNQQLPRRASPAESPSRAAVTNTSSGMSALQLGAAALAGGAWGYLLARQGGMGAGYGQYGAGGITHIHHHGDGSQYGDGATYDSAGADYTQASYGSPPPETSPNVIGADTNNDGLIDSFYGDSNSDGVADVIGHDTDANGTLDRFSMDTNYDGSFDRTFAEVNSPVDLGVQSDFEDVDDAESTIDDSLDDDDCDLDGDDFASEDMDFGDVDFG